MDSPTFRALTPNAKLVLLISRLSCGFSGISVLPAMAEQLAERTGLQRVDVEQAFAELAATGVVEIEAPLLWIVDALDSDPTIKQANKNHCLGVLRHLDGLPQLPIVSRFRDHYRAWLGDPPAMPSGGHPAALRIKEKEKEKETGNRRRETETATAAATTTAAHAGPPRPVGVQHRVPFSGQVKREADLTIGTTERQGDDQGWLNQIEPAHDRAAIAELLALFTTPESRAAWTARLRGYLRGVEMPGGRAATIAALATACRDWDPDRGIPTPALFRKFVDRVMVDLANPVGARRA